MKEFIALPPAWGSKMASRTTSAGYGKTYLLMVMFVLAVSGIGGLGLMTLGGATRGMSAETQALLGNGFIYGSGTLVIGGFAIYYWRRRRTTLTLTASADGVSISSRPGEVYPLHGATLGTWGVTGGMTFGTALHLSNGAHRLVIGGQDRRIPAGTRVDAPDVGYGLPIDIDASISAADFDELLALGGLAPTAPAPSGPTRLVLFTNPLLVQRINSLKTWEVRDFLEQTAHPRLVIDLDERALRVLDANTTAVVAAASPAQVVATPVTYRPPSGLFGLPFPSLHSVLGNVVDTHFSTMPVLHLALPGVPPITVGCRDSNTGLEFRFTWSDAVPTQGAYADFVVSGTDWLTLITTFGLDAHHIDGSAR